MPSFPETTTQLSAMVPDISAFLPGCPNLTIERTVRKTIIDLCQRGRVWSMSATPISMVASTYEYALVPLPAYAEVIDVESAYLLLTDGRKVFLKWTSRGLLQNSRPMWPEDDSGQPIWYMTPTTGFIHVAPTPDAVTTGTINTRIFMRPTASAAEWSTWLYNEYNREIFHGVLHELMAMPERSWSDPKMADYHGKQWTYLLSQATIRAAKEYNSDDLSVQMRPFA